MGVRIAGTNWPGSQPWKRAARAAAACCVLTLPSLSSPNTSSWSQASNWREMTVWEKTCRGDQRQQRRCSQDLGPKGPPTPKRPGGAEGPPIKGPVEAVAG